MQDELLPTPPPSFRPSRALLGPSAPVGVPVPIHPVFPQQPPPVIPGLTPTPRQRREGTESEKSPVVPHLVDSAGYPPVFPPPGPGVPTPPLTMMNVPLLPTQSPTILPESSQAVVVPLSPEGSIVPDQFNYLPSVPPPAEAAPVVVPPIAVPGAPPPLKVEAERPTEEAKEPQLERVQSGLSPEAPRPPLQQEVPPQADVPPPAAQSPTPIYEGHPQAIIYNHPNNPPAKEQPPSAPEVVRLGTPHSSQSTQVVRTQSPTLRTEPPPVVRLSEARPPLTAYDDVAHPATPSAPAQTVINIGESVSHRTEPTRFPSTLSRASTPRSRHRAATPIHRATDAAQLSVYPPPTITTQYEPGRRSPPRSRSRRRHRTYSRDGHRRSRTPRDRRSRTRSTYFSRSPHRPIVIEGSTRRSRSRSARRLRSRSPTTRDRLADAALSGATGGAISQLADTLLYREPSPRPHLSRSRSRRMYSRSRSPRRHRRSRSASLGRRPVDYEHTVHVIPAPTITRPPIPTPSPLAHSLSESARPAPAPPTPVRPSVSGGWIEPYEALPPSVRPETLRRRPDMVRVRSTGRNSPSIIRVASPASLRARARPDIVRVRSTGRTSPRIIRVASPAGPEPHQCPRRSLKYMFILRRYLFLFFSAFSFSFSFSSFSSFSFFLAEVP
ncbi:uncharacterized protein EI90DRAFT_2374197 [Cantharellus anzutake]|uniref:uncharacterized protein n=1 Tax=Cantharellus anzutake TaxID=1750568 RepID=UPI00190847CD|nr:uncharacterized protein EI90DRAFT_2374197 [Cantharellus anzutake]KAF8323608.1 hypothetical protein EI90DRAFT_2374197 [Cantharellus anzutake]